MRKVHVTIALFWLCSAIAGHAWWNSAITSAIAATSAEITDQSPAPGAEVARTPPVESDSPAPQLDMFGNEIEHAIADYRVDRGGEVYEQHSPETAVAKLGSPSS